MRSLSRLMSAFLSLPVLSTPSADPNSYIPYKTQPLGPLAPERKRLRS